MKYNIEKWLEWFIKAFNTVYEGTADRLQKGSTTIYSIGETIYVKFDTSIVRGRTQDRKGNRILETER